MFLTTIELVVVGALSFALINWGGSSAPSQDQAALRAKQVGQIETQLRLQGGADPGTINSKELELIKRGITIPKRGKDPVAHTAELDFLLRESAGRAEAYIPLSRKKFQVFTGGTDAKTSGIVLSRMADFAFAREPPRAPGIYEENVF